MSTILKALQKNNQNVSFEIDNSSDKNWKWLIFTALIVIAVLLSAVFFLLFKMPPANQTGVQPLAINSANVQLTSSGESNVTNELVSNVDFKTKPLPPLKKASVESLEGGDSRIEIPAPVQIAPTPRAALAQDLALESVPSDLQQRFENAVQIEADNERTSSKKAINTQKAIATDIRTMPASFQYQVPLMRYDAHMYSSNAIDSWIRINGEDLRVGDYIGDVALLAIEPNQSVFRLDEMRFTLNSLQDWEGNKTNYSK